jgi:hypothetical protein
MDNPAAERTRREFRRRTAKSSAVPLIEELLAETWLALETTRTTSDITH